MKIIALLLLDYVRVRDREKAEIEMVIFIKCRRVY